MFRVMHHSVASGYDQTAFSPNENRIDELVGSIAQVGSQSMSLKIFNAFGLTGTWVWNLQTNEQLWSHNLWRLLGLHPEQTTPSYEQLYRLIHPDDQNLMPEANQISYIIGCPDQIFRIIRPDGGSRTLSSRIEICQAQDGPPTTIIGILLDMMDHTLLGSAEELERERVQVELKQPAAFTLASIIYANADYPDEWINGGHLRAARGLLNWTMQDLSKASGLSLSTVRRIEEEPNGSRGRSVQCVLAALRQAGIQFPLIDGTMIAVARAL